MNRANRVNMNWVNRVKQLLHPGNPPKTVLMLMVNSRYSE
jgi:hypothetical protein